MPTFACISDLHLNEELPVQVDQWNNWKCILKDIAAMKIDQIIIGGEMGHPSSYLGFFDDLLDTFLQFKIIPGNHDIPNYLLPLFSNPENHY